MRVECVAPHPGPKQEVTNSLGNIPRNSFSGPAPNSNSGVAGVCRHRVRQEELQTDALFCFDFVKQLPGPYSKVLRLSDIRRSIHPGPAASKCIARTARHTATGRKHPKTGRSLSCASQRLRVAPPCPSNQDLPSCPCWCSRTRFATLPCKPQCHLAAERSPSALPH